jgi:hypothetical protein
VQEPVQNKNLDFRQSRMAVLRGLTSRHGQADGKVACNSLFAGGRIHRRKRKNICRAIDAAVRSIQTPDRRIGSQQNAYLSAKLDGFLRNREKTRQGARRGGSGTGSFPHMGPPGRRRRLRITGIQAWIEKNHRPRKLYARAGCPAPPSLDFTRPANYCGFAAWLGEVEIGSRSPSPVPIGSPSVRGRSRCCGLADS